MKPHCQKKSNSYAHNYTNHILTWIPVTMLMAAQNETSTLVTPVSALAYMHASTEPTPAWSPTAMGSPRWDEQQCRLWRSLPSMERRQDGWRRRTGAAVLKGPSQARPGSEWWPAQSVCTQSQGTIREGHSWACFPASFSRRNCSSTAFSKKYFVYFEPNRIIFLQNRQ